ncbi:NAD(P)/FAD-dependent oxidoreductase [Exiguobacterium sp. RIT594]|uniref:NAD(P)/FAD-dependent oxidoreductase n=1 Tax=Exiguobacterium sp. RIT594 TaxID=2282449 RepID=UPI000DF7ADF9|nr:FAD-dependent oxidoreductase [Exiguobacterium sp. RIT594]RDB32991.1 FAD-dependent oxidoreductase [Exiguobacterium sp. RIT594]
MYDVTIIGAGVAGIFLAHELMAQGQTVLLIDAGKPLEQRTTQEAYLGFGGLGKSEGKYNYSAGFGGELAEKLGPEKMLQLMQQVDALLCRYGADEVDTYSTSNPELATRARAAGLETIETTVRHLGTGLSERILRRLEAVLQKQITFRFETFVETIEKQHNGFLLTTKHETFSSQRVVFATGRSGTEWMQAQLQTLGLTQNKTRLDLGIRIEMEETAFRTLLQDTFETKLAYASAAGTAVTYCMNPKGRIIRKHQEGLVMPDGQNFREQESGTTNLNFTLFLPRYFATLAEANHYAASVIGRINQGTDRIVVQRLGDLRSARMTSSADLAENKIRPTLEATAGHLMEEVPETDITVLLEFLDRLEHLLETPLSPDTLLYGMDGKFYAPVLSTSPVFETDLPGLYAIGDCSGVTHSLSQAAASGLYLGQHLTQKTAVLRE